MCSSQHVSKVINQFKINHNIIIINRSDIVPYHTIIIMTQKINKNVKIVILVGALYMGLRLIYTSISTKNDLV